MRRFLTILIFFIVTIIIEGNQKRLTKDKDFLFRQEFVYQVLRKPEDLAVYHPDIVDRAKNFKVEDLRSLSVNKNVNDEFIARYKYGLLPRRRSFNNQDPRLLAQLTSFSNVLNAAEDFDTFALLATWSRDEINEMIWLYGLRDAVLKRSDLRYVREPNPNELTPQSCYNSDVIFQYYALRKDDCCMKNISKNVIKAQYSKIVSQLTYDMDNRVVYFTEDIGLGPYYTLAILDLSFSINSKEYNLPSYRRGERYFNIHKQLLARYELERLSNGVPKAADIDWDHDVFTGYYSNMIGFHGEVFPSRPAISPIPYRQYKNAQLARDYERRVTDAADSGRIQLKYGILANSDTDEFFSDLMNLIQGNSDSLNRNFYGSLDSTARSLLGDTRTSTNKYNAVLNALQTSTASVRDPAFYGIYKKIIDIGYRYKNLLQPYTKEELGFPGVSIMNVCVDKILTYFDQYESFLGYQSCPESSDNKTIPILVQQYRLNHKKFDIQVKINSTTCAKGIVRIFIGPMTDVEGEWIDIDDAQYDFFQLDQFVIDLKEGMNVINRSDCEFVFQEPEELRGDIFYEAIRKAIDENKCLEYYEQPYGFPRRLMIPRGRTEGLPLRLLVIVNRFEPDAKGARVYTEVAGGKLDDRRALGFPLDRPLLAYNFEAPNMIIKKVLIYHEGRPNGYRDVV